MNRRGFIGTSALAAAGLAVVPGRETAAEVTPVSDQRVAAVKTFKVPRALFVKVETTDGLSGWGEASPNDQDAAQSLIENTLQNYVVGKDPFNTDAMWHEMLAEEYDLGPGGVLSYAMAGIDTALWDLKGKMLGVPVWKLLGGKHRDGIKAYASYSRIKGGKPMTPAQAAATAADFVDQGFLAVKMRLRYGEFNMDVNPEEVFINAAEIRKAIGDDIELMIDANNGFSANRAAYVGQKLFEEYGVQYFEEPVSAHHYRALRQVVEETSCRIVVGEHEYNKWQLRDLILQGDPDVVNPDVIKAGGITETVKMAAVASAFNKPVMLHSTRPTLGTAAALQVAITLEHAAEYIEYSGEQKAPNLIPLFENKIQMRDGYLIPPEGPGLGLQPIEEMIIKEMNN